MIWVFVAVLSIAAMGALALSLRAGAPPREDADSMPAIFNDQLAEIDRDVARGVLPERDADAARVEIRRNVLRHLRMTGAGQLGRPRSSNTGVVLAMAFVPLFAVSYYTQFGSPGLSGMAVSEQREARLERQRVLALTSQLEDRLEADDAGGAFEGWMLLGQTRIRLGQYSEAATAYEIASKRPEADSSVFSMLAEALIAGENGIVTPAADKAIDEAALRDPSNPAVTFYKALSLQQSGRSAAAHDLIVARLDAVDGFFPWMESLVAQANRIGEGIGRAPLSLRDFAPMIAGPDADDIANAAEMSTEERSAFIRSMVQRLADRLEEEPDDLDGWMRLGRAYVVLGDTNAARQAYQKASALARDLSDSDPRNAQINKALGSLRQ